MNIALQERCLIVTLEGLVGTNSKRNEDSLYEAILLSQMKTFYDLRQDFHVKNIEQELDYNESYLQLVIHVLYVLNFKKKFCQKNLNRLIVNYFQIIYQSIRKKINILTIPEYILSDNPYLNTFALNNLYAISNSDNNE